MEYKNVSEGDWSIRDIVSEQLEEKLPAIAEFLIENEIDYEGDAEAIFNTLLTFLDDLDFTAEEMEFVIQNVQCYTAIQHLIAQGVVEDLGDGRVKCVQSSQQ